MKTHFCLMIGLLLWMGCASPSRRTESPVPPVGLEPEKIQSSTVTEMPIQEEETDKSSSVESEENEVASQGFLSMEQKQALYEQFIEGAYYDEHQQYDKAGQKYLEALKLAPDSQVLSEMTGEVFLRSGNVEEALRVSRAAIESGTATPEMHYLLARALAIQQKWADAITEYETVIRLSPQSIAAMGELALLYMQSNQLESAFDLYEQMERVNPEQKLFYQYRRALILSQLGRLDEALSAYQGIVELAPAFLDAYLRIAAIWEMKNEDTKALEVYLTSLNHVRSIPDEMSIRYRLGEIYIKRKSLAEAFYQFSQIKKKDPNDVNAQRMLVSIYLQQENHEEALAEASALAEKVPGEYQIHVVLRELLTLLDREKEGYERFIESFSQCIQKKSRRDTQFFLLEVVRSDFIKKAQTYNLLHRIEELLGSCQPVFPDMVRLPFALSAFELLTGTPGMSPQGLSSLLTAMNQALEEQNGQRIESFCSELLLWYKVRISFSQYGFSNLLREWTEKANEAYPENLQVTRLISQVYVDQNLWDKAEKALAAFQEIVGDNAALRTEAILQLSYVYDLKGALDLLEALLIQAIQQYPEDAQVYNFLGYAYAERNIKLDESLALIQKAIELNPQDGNIVDSLGWIYYRLGRYEEALQQLQRAVEMEKNHPIILDHLGDVLIRMGQRKKAVEHWRMSQEFGPEYPSEWTPEFRQRIEKKIKEAENPAL